MKRFLIALQFLTIFPVGISAKGGSASGGKSEIRNKDLGASLLCFPLVGLLVGALLSASVFLFAFLPSLVRAALILIISIIISGGIHLDGFADTCDGFYGSKSQEEILRIMRDSRIGVMGTIGITSLLLLKFTLIASIPQDFLWKSLILMATFSRWSQVLACGISGYARQEGKAKYFIEYANKKDLITGVLLTLALFLFIAKVKGALIFLLALLCTLLFIKYIKRKIGGMTGDTIGAVSEAAEAFALFFTLILSR